MMYILKQWRDGNKDKGEPGNYVGHSSYPREELDDALTQAKLLHEKNGRRTILQEVRTLWDSGN